MMHSIPHGFVNFNHRAVHKHGEPCDILCSGTQDCRALFNSVVFTPLNDFRQI